MKKSFALRVLRIAHSVVMLHERKLIFNGTKDAFAACDEPHVAQFRTGSPEGPIAAAGQGVAGKDLVGP